jgi:hypothetical protein
MVLRCGSTASSWVRLQHFGFTPKADIVRTSQNRRDVPTTDIGPAIGHVVGSAEHPQFAERALRNICRGRAGYSALMLRVRMTVPHFSVSSAMSLPKSAAEPTSGALARSASRPLIL